MVPEKFKKLGLFYFKHIEKWWLPRLYHFAMMEYVPNLNPYRSFIVQSKNMKRKNFLVYKNGLDQVVDSYIRNVKKYKNIAESNQGKFIVGIQPAKHILELEEQIWITQPNREEVIHLLKDLYSELQQKARKQGFIVFNDLFKSNPCKKIDLACISILFSLKRFNHTLFTNLLSIMFIGS